MLFQVITVVVTRQCFLKCIRLKMVSKSKNQARFMLSCSPFVERKGEVVKNTSRIIVFNPFIAGQIERNEGVEDAGSSQLLFITSSFLKGCSLPAFDNLSKSTLVLHSCCYGWEMLIELLRGSPAQSFHGMHRILFHLFIAINQNYLHEGIPGKSWWDWSSKVLVNEWWSLAEDDYFILLIFWLERRLIWKILNVRNGFKDLWFVKWNSSRCRRILLLESNSRFKIG